MNQPLRALIIEAVADAAPLVVAELRQLHPQIKILVASGADFELSPPAATELNAPAPSAAASG